ncbi:MAG: methyltransferase domain-containing protein [Thermoproteota archaeon]
MARRFLSSSKAALDLGTGGGEILLSMKDVYPMRVVATEDYVPNVILAHERLAPYSVEVVKTDESRLEQKLPFTGNIFDLVIDRHTCFNVLEVARILRPDGAFITEQVDGRDNFDLFRAFDCMPQWPFFTLDFILKRIALSGLVVEIAQEWEGKTFFKDVGAIVYYLKAIPWIVPGFTVDSHSKYLLKLQERMDKEGKLSFSQRLLLIKARKV